MNYDILSDKNHNLLSGTDFDILSDINSDILSGPHFEEELANGLGSVIPWQEREVLAKNVKGSQKE